uniref:Uncharacterized protein n=1 Tax=Trypanosoma vivax (strain Y486) TaxID=1055687 RepID=G0TUJ2_TRYVY|nr:hypothetical protein, unlikely [Trypanosoma vivax Y486]
MSRSTTWLFSDSNAFAFNCIQLVRGRLFYKHVYSFTLSQQQHKYFTGQGCAADSGHVDSTVQVNRIAPKQVEEKQASRQVREIVVKKEDVLTSKLSGMPSM